MNILFVSLEMQILTTPHPGKIYSSEYQKIFLSKNYSWMYVT